MTKKEYDRRIEDEARSKSKAAWENASWAYGLANCIRCLKTTHDYTVLNVDSVICSDCLTPNEVASFIVMFRAGAKFSQSLTVQMVLEWLRSYEVQIQYGDVDKWLEFKFKEFGE